MDNFLILLLVNALAVFITAYLLKGVTVKNFFSAIITALLIGVVNAVIKPIFVFLTIPVTIITLGLFLLVIDALMILLVDKMLSGFRVKNFGWALLFSITLSIVTSVLVWILG
ncbi:MAG: phage holin family protein [Vicingaceae bacterium]